MSTANINEDQFQSVRPQKKKRRGAAAIPKAVTFETRIQRVESDIGGSQWLSGCQEQVRAMFESMGWVPSEIQVLCLGLGSPMESKSAAAQLVFIASICDACHIARDRVSFFDPHFCDEDSRGIVTMGFQVLSENKRGKHVLESKTLLFMPHCGVELYENILRRNWKPDAMGLMLLLGNILHDYAIGTPIRKLGDERPCLSRILKYLNCAPIKPLDAYPTAFNALGLQYVDLESLPPQNDLMWILPSPAPEEKSSTEIT